MKVISWNLLRLTGAAAEDVAKLVEREKPDVLLMQEVTEHMDALPSLVGGHFHRSPGRVAFTGSRYGPDITMSRPTRCRSPRRGCPAACRAVGRRSSR